MVAWGSRGGARAGARPGLGRTLSASLSPIAVVFAGSRPVSEKTVSKAMREVSVPRLTWTSIVSIVSIPSLRPAACPGVSVVVVVM